MGNRLNARLDDALARKVEALQRRLGVSTTEVVRRSIECLYRAELGPHVTPAALVEGAGLIGCSEGDPALSTRYKAELAASLRDKT